MVNNTPLVTIGMPVYNDLPFLRKAIDSLLAQTYRNFELIISDDGSTDGSAEVCEAYAKNDHRIWYFRQPNRLGISENINFLIREARGDFFMVAADDDIWDPRFIEILLNKLLENESLVSAFCPMVFIGENDEILDNPAPRAPDYSGKWAFIRLFKLLKINDDGLGYGLCRKEAIKGIRFPVWKGINRETAYDNFYPPVCFLLAKGDTALAGDRPLWFNRVKTGAAVHHQEPYQSGTSQAVYAGFLRKINLITASIAQIRAAGKPVSAALITPFMIWYWLLRLLTRAAFSAENTPRRMLLAQVLVQAMMFFSLPVIGRTYSPDTVGVWGFYQSAVMILWSFSQLRTDQLLITSDIDGERNGLFTLGILLHGAFSCLMILALQLVPAEWSVPGVSPALLLLYCLGFGMVNQTIALLVSKNAYGDVNFLRLGVAVLAYPFAWVSFYIFGSNGLIMSLLLSVWAPLFPVIIARIKNWRPDFPKNIFQKIKGKAFWLTGNSVVVAVSDHVFALVIATVYDLKTAAVFFLVQRLLMAPVSLMAGTYGLYFYRKMHELFRVQSLTTALFFRFWKHWAIPAILFYAVAVLFGEQLFTWFFGGVYTGAGLIAAAITIRCLVQFLSAPMSMGFYAIQQPRYPFFAGVISLVITLAGVGLMSSHLLPLHSILWIHTVLMTANLLIYNVLMVNAVSKLPRSSTISN